MKKRRYRHVSHRKRDYSDSECDDRDDDNMSGYSEVSRDEWGRVRRGRDHHHSRHRRHPSSSRRRHRRRRSPLSHRRRRHYSSKYSSDEGGDVMSDRSEHTDERCSKKGERHPEKRKSKRFSRSRSPISRGEKRAGENPVNNGEASQDCILPMVVDKKQKTIVEFFTRKSVKKSETSDTAGKSPTCGNSPNDTSKSKSHKRKISETSPQSQKRLKAGGALNTTASTPDPSAGGAQIHTDRSKQTSVENERGQDGNTPEKEK